MSRPVTFYDTTLRDGEQTPYVVFSPEQKLILARKLEALGMDVIEAGFPAASESEFDAVARISREIKNSRIAGLARCRIADIDKTAKALESAKSSRISVVLPVSDRHLKHSLRITRAQAEENIGTAILHAKSLVDDVEFIATDATRTEFTALLSSLRSAASSGATVLVIADTVGVALPEEFGKLVSLLLSDLRRDFPKISFGIHCHDDFGLAVANSLSGLRAGADQVEGTINGLGERAGNAALEELAMILHEHSAELNLSSRIRTEKILEVSKLVSELSGVAVQHNKALVGQNAFLHSAGMHQQAMLADPLTFEPFDPRLIGFNASLEDRIIFGKFIGRNALKKMLETDGISVSESALDGLIARLRLAIERRESVSRNLLREWAESLSQSK